MAPLADAIATIAPLRDLRSAIAALPRRADATALPGRTGEGYVTIHYGGAAQADRSAAAEQASLLSYARHHLRKNWARAGQTPIYADRAMYDLAVLSDGAIALLDDEPIARWHCGNATGNATSWAVVLPIGPGQPLTDAQAAALGRLCDMLRARGGLPRAAVVGHCEWPRGDGPPAPSPAYRLQAGQSPCPGPLAHAALAAYRAAEVIDGPDAPILGPSRITAEQLYRALTGVRGGAYDRVSVRTIVAEYDRQCAALGVDLRWAGAQLIVETDSLRSWWCQRPRRNPAGIGVTGATRPAGPQPMPPGLWAFDGEVWRRGLSFDAWADQEARDGVGAVTHHLGRLLAYALPPRSWPAAGARGRAIAVALDRLPLGERFHGCAPTVAGLAGTWAEDPDYARKLVAAADRLRRI